jgi:DNA invertase Pin-like site-specific DNA recombinase
MTGPVWKPCLKSMREDDTLIVWKLDRLGRNLHHLVNTIRELMERKIGFRVLTGQGANIDTTTASGRLVFGIFAALAEFERELIRERTIAGLSSARAQRRPALHYDAGQTPPGASRHGRASHQGK